MVWVCGASKGRGLGLGCAQALLREGVNVLIVARGAEFLTANAIKIIANGARSAEAGELLGVTDTTTSEGGPAVFAVRKDFGIVVTNAGSPPPGDFRDWNRVVWIKATVDGMAARGFGRIVNITSSSVKALIDILVLPNGARSGLTGFVAGAARTRLAAQGVTINNLLPGAFDTDRLRGTLQGAATKTGQPLETVMDARRKNISAQRFGTPEEFGAICAFLCSMPAAYLTGQNVSVDGGANPATHQRF